LLIILSYARIALPCFVVLLKLVGIQDPLGDQHNLSHSIFMGNGH